MALPGKGVEMFNWEKAFAVGKAELVMAMEEVAKRYAVKAAEVAKPLTPFRFGTLRASLTKDVEYDNRNYSKITGKRVDLMSYLVGSALPYAARQEYEHKTRSHFVHKGIQKIKPDMKRDAVKVAKMVLGKAWDKG